MGFFGSFFGDDQRKDISNANKQANAALQTGYNSQQGYYDQASKAYDPYVQSGGAANTFYSNALGLNGNDARATAQNTITSDPLFTGALAMQNGNTQAAMNARGSGAGGAFIQAAQNNLYQNYNNALDRYANLGQQGLSATGAQSGVYQGQGNNAFNYGATKAGNAINYGNALAESRNIGTNNILGAISAATGAYNAFANPGVMAKR